MCDLMEEGEKVEADVRTVAEVVVMSRMWSSKEMRARTHSSQPAPGWCLPHPQKVNTFKTEVNTLK